MKQDPEYFDSYRLPKHFFFFNTSLNDFLEYASLEVF